MPTKKWDDANDQDGIRTNSVKVQLYANGEPTGDVVELSADNQWSHTWTGFFQKECGQDIAYTVREVEVPEGYTATVSGDATTGFTVTNTHAPETTSVPVTKKWAGSEGGPVTIHLLADGADTGRTLTLSADNGWADSFDGLAKYANGKAIVYTISEDPVKGDTSKVSGDADSGFTVTNTEKPKPDKPKSSKPNKSKDHKSNKPNQSRKRSGYLPQTGDVNIPSFALLLMASVLTFAVAISLRHRNSLVNNVTQYLDRR